MKLFEDLGNFRTDEIRNRILEALDFAFIKKDPERLVEDFLSQRGLVDSKGKVMAQQLIEW